MVEAGQLLRRRMRTRFVQRIDRDVSRDLRVLVADEQQHRDRELPPGLARIEAEVRMRPRIRDLGERRRGRSLELGVRRLAAERLLELRRYDRDELGLR